MIGAAKYDFGKPVPQILLHVESPYRLTEQVWAEQRPVSLNRFLAKM